MKFIGQLFLRNLLSPRVIVSVLHELLLEETPKEYKVECTLELLTTVGYTLEEYAQTYDAELNAQTYDAELNKVNGYFAK